MATNYFYNAWTNLISIIKVAYPRFADTERIKVRDVLMSGDLSYPDCILIKPENDELLGERTKGRDSAFHLTLTYIIKQYPEVDYEVLSQFAENLIDTLEDNRASGTNWHNISVGNVLYSVDFPVPEEGEIVDHYGFTMEIIMLKGKYD